MTFAHLSAVIGYIEILLLKKYFLYETDVDPEAKRWHVLCGKTRLSCPWHWTRSKRHLSQATGHQLTLKGKPAEEAFYFKYVLLSKVAIILIYLFVYWYQQINKFLLESKKVKARVVWEVWRLTLRRLWRLQVDVAATGGLSQQQRVYSLSSSVSCFHSAGRCTLVPNSDRGYLYSLAAAEKGGVTPRVCVRETGGCRGRMSQIAMMMMRHY